MCYQMGRPEIIDRLNDLDTTKPGLYQALLFLGGSFFELWGQAWQRYVKLMFNQLTD